MKNLLKVLGFSILACGLVAGYGSPALAAGDYPNKPIKMVIPWGPGGGSDVAGRTLAAGAKEFIGQELVVANVTGGGGTVGGRETLASQADGYTLLFGNTPLMTSFHTGTSDFNYDAFTPICGLLKLNHAFLVRADEPYKTLDEFLKYARAHPNQVKAGCVIGSLSHYALLSLQETTGVQFRIIPSQGESARVVALKGKHIDFTALTLAAVNKYLASGDFRALAVAAEERDPQTPDVPTCRELGYEVIAPYNYYLLAPKGLSEDKVEFLDSVFRKVLSKPATIEALGKLTVYPRYFPHDKVGAAMAAENKYLEGVAVRNKVKK